MRIPALFSRLVTLGLLALIAMPLLAATAWRDIQWKDLQPDAPALRKQVNDLPQEKKDRLLRAVNQRELQDALKKGQIKPEHLVENDKALLAEKFADVQALVEQIARYEARRVSELVGELDQQPVRLSGYLLPLQEKDGKVTEFLLVPVIGACIHVPPPPPNQLVVVRYPAGYASERLFAPITVTGKLSVRKSRSNLALADGSAEVDVGYQMQADGVTEYKRKPN
ncbi:DUF3299 domain-containing protein [Chitinilyticum litopenaei]|uniref:DUF3299 domain-containing protein n=1 Tax=Chitinilyticum litopenaei TaxID=1121276 RepID=UPI0003F89D4F|nr:DUF3299 domain-containing protein [Chitinilyticum litopenaei]